MGRHSRKNKVTSERSRMRYEQTIDSGLAGGKPRSSRVKGNAPSSRVGREAANAAISNTRLAAAKNLDKVPPTLMAERDRREKRTKRRALIVAGAVLALLLSAAAGAMAYYFNIANKMAPKNIPQSIKKAPPLKPQEPYNIALFGTDARRVTENCRTDTIMLARVIPAEKRIWMVSIPRDYRVELPDHGARKINAAYAYGGAELAIETLEKVSGQKVDHYMLVNFFGFEDVVDAMGGIEIDVPITIDGTKPGIEGEKARKADRSKGKKASKIVAGPQILDGAHALTFVRYRGYADADWGRTGAQQLFFKALIDQMSDTPVTKLPGLVGAVADNVETSLTPLQLMQVAREMRGTKSANLYTITVPGTWKSPFVWPDKDGEAEVWRKFGKEPFKEDEKKEEKALPKASQTTVTVRNGTMRAGIAKEAAAILRARGFTILDKDIGNTENQSVYDQTLIVYKENKAAAELVAQYLPDNTKIVESRGMYRYDTEIMLVLGSDWDIAKVPVADVKTTQ